MRSFTRAVRPRNPARKRSAARVALEVKNDRWQTRGSGPESDAWRAKRSREHPVDADRSRVPRRATVVDVRCDRGCDQTDESVSGMACGAEVMPQNDQGFLICVLPTIKSVDILCARVETNPNAKEKQNEQAENDRHDERAN